MYSDFERSSQTEYIAHKLIHFQPEQVASLLDRLKRAETLESLVDEMKNLKEWPTLHGKVRLTFIILRNVYFIELLLYFKQIKLILVYICTKPFVPNIAPLMR